MGQWEWSVEWQVEEEVHQMKLRALQTGEDWEDQIGIAYGVYPVVLHHSSRLRGG